MLIQIHHQSKVDRSRTEFCSQREINNNEEMRNFHKDTAIRYPLPDDFDWLLCNEGSEFFWKVSIDGNYNCG